MPWCACTEGTWCLMHRCMRRRHITVPYRDLGIMVSGDLSWSSNLNHICSKAYTALYRIQHAFPSVIASLKKQLYITIVRSNLYYGSQLRRPHIKKNILLLERAQRRVTKHILADYSSNYKDRLLKLSLLPLMYWLKLNNVMFPIKALKISVLDFASFSSNTSTRASTFHKLFHNYAKTRNISPLLLQ